MTAAGGWCWPYWPPPPVFPQTEKVQGYSTYPCYINPESAHSWNGAILGRCDILKGVKMRTCAYPLLLTLWFVPFVPLSDILTTVVALRGAILATASLPASPGMILRCILVYTRTGTFLDLGLLDWRIQNSSLA